MKLTTHLHLLARLRMRGTVPLLPLCPSLAWTGKTLPFVTLWLKFNITSGIKFFYDTMYIVDLKKVQAIYLLNIQEADLQVA